MTDPKTYKFNTKTLHSGHQPDKNFGSRAVPIYQTTSYLFQDADHAAALFNLEEVDISIAEYPTQLYLFLKKELQL